MAADGGAVLDHFSVSGPSHQNTNATFTVTITSLDSSNVPINYNGGTATIPSSSTHVKIDANNDGKFTDNVATFSGTTVPGKITKPRSGKIDNVSGIFGVWP